MAATLCMVAMWLGAVGATYLNNNDPQRDLVVLVAPSVWDAHYSSRFLEIISFQIYFAKQISRNDNVLVLADKHTMPFLDGRSHKIKDKLPTDILLQANLYDINVRDYAPFGIRQFSKFTYVSRQMDAVAAGQLEQSMQRFLAEHDIHLERKETKLHLSAADVVDNGKDKAVANALLIPENGGRLPDWAAKIKMLAVFNKVAFLPMPEMSNMTEHEESVSRRFDNMFAFVDDDVLLMAAVPESSEELIKHELRRAFYKDLRLVQLPEHHAADDYTGTCGMYTAMLTTHKNLYVPVFGNDPANWALGHSTMMDKMITQVVQVDTTKRVLPINVPRRVCAAGLSLRSLTWTLHGREASKLIEAARYSEKKRFLQRLLRHRRA